MNDDAKKETRNEDARPAVDISTRAMLVSLRVSFWGAHVTDKKVTEEVNREHAASKDAGKYRKHLFANNAPEHRAAVNAAVTARGILYENTLPWTDEGWRLLPSASYFEFTERLREQRAKMNACVDAFLDRYDELVDQARADLNGLWRAEDYPPAREVREKFGLVVEFSPLPAAGDFRLDLPDDERRLIEESVTNRVTSGIDAAMRDAWNQLHEAVSHLGARIKARADAEAAERGEGEKLPPFHASAISNLIETAEALGRLNVTGDPELEAMRKRVLDDLGDFTAEDIKGNDVMRRVAADRVNGIMAAMAEFYRPDAKEGR